MSQSSSTLSSGTVIPTPGTSDTSSRRSSNAQPAPNPLPSSPLLVTQLSVTSWRTPYPVIGQFAVTDNNVVAASSHGLIYFKRVRDHASKPWTEYQKFVSILTTTFYNYSVSGIALFADKNGKFLHVYCVSSGVLHAFYRSEEEGTSFWHDPCPPLQNLRVSGTPAVARIPTDCDKPDFWCLVVPSQSGGLLYTSTRTRSTTKPYYGQTQVPNQDWASAKHIAKDLGIISAVSVSATYTTLGRSYNYERKVYIVAVLIASGRLHVVEGPWSQENSYDRYPPTPYWKWGIKDATRIHHPGEVTGNPTLISHDNRTTGSIAQWQLDLLVPSAEGGIFHFVRTPSTPNEWHMIGRIKFPQAMPLAACLTCTRDRDEYNFTEFRAIIQSGGRLFQTRTREGAAPWSGSCLKPILGPGPFAD